MSEAKPARFDFVQRIEPKATWNEVALPAKDIAALRAIAGRIKRPGALDRILMALKLRRGTAVLFAGVGAGKLAVAEAIASELGRDLYRIDLAAVVSKYIGETEKNLSALFDTAEDAGAVLFFDEADALFARRSDVKDAHDRYANAEVAYLLQRLEACGGLAILATSEPTNIDPAFLRRLCLTVRFAKPG